MAAIRMTGVLRNLPEGQIKLIGLSERCRNHKFGLQHVDLLTYSREFEAGIERSHAEHQAKQDVRLRLQAHSYNKTMETLRQIAESDSVAHRAMLRCIKVSARQLNFATRHQSDVEAQPKMRCQASRNAQASTRA